MRFLFDLSLGIYLWSTGLNIDNSLHENQLTLNETSICQRDSVVYDTSQIFPLGVKWRLDSTGAEVSVKKKDTKLVMGAKKNGAREGDTCPLVYLSLAHPFFLSPRYFQARATQAR